MCACRSQHAYLTSVRDIEPGGEITFDYGEHYRAVAADKLPDDTSFLGSVSLSGSSTDSVLTGSGICSERERNGRICARVTEDYAEFGSQVDLEPGFGFKM